MDIGSWRCGLRTFAHARRLALRRRAGYGNQKSGSRPFASPPYCMRGFSFGDH